MRNRRLRCRVLWTCGLLLCTQAGAVEPSSKTLIGEATEAFSSLDFEGALLKLDRALSNPGNQRSDLVRIYSLEALCFLSLNRAEQARQAFIAALSLDPSLRLDRDASPIYRAPFQEVLRKGVAPFQVEVEVPETIEPDQPVPVTARLVADPAALLSRLVVYHRRAGQAKFSAVRVRLVESKSTSFYLPPSLWQVKGNLPIEWFAVARDRFGGELWSRGDQSRPGRIRVEPREIPKAVAASEEPAARDPWYRKWWIWALVGGAAAAGGTVAVIMLRPGAPSQRDFAVEVR